MARIPFGKKAQAGITMFLPSAVKIPVYRLMGAHIGKNVRIGSGSFIIAEKIVLKDGVGIGSNVHIICEGFFADEETRIAANVVIEGESECRLGKNCYVGPSAYIDVASSVTLEDNVGMGGHIHSHGVWPPYTEGYPRRFGSVIIKKGAWVPPHVTIFPGVTVGEEAMIGSGAVVTKSIPARTFATGIPAKVIRSVDEIQLKLTLHQKDARVREILRHFKKWIEGSMAVQENIKVDGHSFVFVLSHKSFFRTKTWGVHYTSEVLTPTFLEGLFSLNGRFAKIVIISLKEIPPESLQKLRENIQFHNFFEWLDLENYCSKRSWSNIFLILRRFFNSYYGVRFELDHKLE